MNIIMTIIFRITIALIIYKSFIKKIQRKFLFFKNIEEIHISKNQTINILITTTILISEISIITIIIILWNYRNIAIIIGVILQMFYLGVLIKNYNIEFENNCNCYSNIPKRADFKSICENIKMIFLYLSLYIIGR